MYRMSLNSYTTPFWTFKQDVDAYARAGFTGIGIYRPKVTVKQAQIAKRLLRQADLTATSVCIAGFFTDAQPHDRVEDAIQAIHLAAELEAQSVTLISGPAPNGDRVLGEMRLCSCLNKLLPIAEACNVVLALEPLHPMYAHMSFLVSLHDALEMLAQFNTPWLQVIVDLYHLWWDQSLPEALISAANQVACVHIADWREPRSLNDRANIGHGIIPLRELLSKIADAGYTGFYEAEVLSDELWEHEGPELVQTCYQSLYNIMESLH